jgi:hypothetical protein
MEKRIRQIVIAIIVLSMAIIGFALADPSISALSQTQGITVTTSVSNQGEFSNSQEMSLSLPSTWETDKARYF